MGVRIGGLDHSMVPAFAPLIAGLGARRRDRDSDSAFLSEDRIAATHGSCFRSAQDAQFFKGYAMDFYKVLRRPWLGRSVLLDVAGNEQDRR